MNVLYRNIISYCFDAYGVEVSVMPINWIHCAKSACLFNFYSQVGRRNKSLYTYQLVSLLSSNTSFHAANNVLLCLSKFIAIFHYFAHTVNESNNKNMRKIQIKHRQATDSQSSSWAIDKNKKWNDSSNRWCHFKKIMFVTGFLQHYLLKLNFFLNYFFERFYDLSH